ncbi:MAG: RecX family transcriptional regulator [Geminicoccaceae bacterium]|nr:RecX family transcriptional regulator [Geminicoccaceae bacterium]
MSPERGRAGRLAKAPTPERLRRRALHYLERFPSGEANLRRVLRQRALREAAALDLDSEAVAATVDAVVAEMAGLGLVDDRAFAEGRARSLLAKGRPPSRVRQTLRAKGIDPNTARSALDGLAEGEGLDEARAALAFARRRRLGPYRKGEADPGRELAILARAGFTYATAKRVVEAEDEAAVLDLER